MLEFTVGNYRSFYKKCTFSLEAQSISEEPKSNIVRIEPYKIVKTAAIYGPNSSGKSNLIMALDTMKLCIISSVRLNDGDSLPYDPFLLYDSEESPTFFEVLFLMNNVRYRYGFEYTRNSIVSEWLFTREGNRKEKTFFIRTKDGIGIVDKNYPDGIGNESRTNDNRLFLSLCAQLGGEISKQIIGWFSNGYKVISGLKSEEYKNLSKEMFFEKKEGSEEALAFFKTLQLGFKNLLSERVKSNAITLFWPGDDASPRTELNIKLSTVHPKYNKNGDKTGEAVFNLETQESAGTLKLIELSGPIFETLLKGTILIVDELDAKMHPLISQYIIKLFNDTETNPHNAQLIFSTHDTHLLSAHLLRRDQIWFTEKDNKEQTDLYSMMDIVLPDGSKPRNDTNYEKNYINGRYGAIPYIMND